MINNKILVVGIASAIIIVVAILIATNYTSRETLPPVTETNRSLTTIPSVINTGYQIHANVTTTIFWIGESAASDNGYISNTASAWDDFWLKDFGGIDDPNNRNGSLPAGFTPKENPFYFALPYDDFDSTGKRKADASMIYWYGKTSLTNTESILKNHWIKITKGIKTAYAQWEDVGPTNTDDLGYVFGSHQPQYIKSGLDVSPAVRDLLGLSDVDKTYWQFVNDTQIPVGPWNQIITTSQTHWNNTSAITPLVVNRTNTPVSNITNTTKITSPATFGRPLSFVLWPSLYDEELPILKDNLISGDMVFLQTTDPTLIQQYKTGYFAPGVLVYSVFRSKGVDDIETNAQTLRAGFDIISEDYESGPTYEPSFVTDETQALAIFQRCQAAVQEYNTRTGSHALLWVTPSYREVGGENWDWGQVRQKVDILQVQTQPWQESNPTRSLEAAQHVDQTGGHDFFAQTSISGDHTVQGAANLAQDLATVRSVKGVMIFTGTNADGLQQILGMLRQAQVPD